LRLPHTQIWNCTNPTCRLRFAFPQLDDESLAKAYTELYYPKAEHRSATHENTPPDIFRQLFHNLGGELGSLSGKTILDYGCGNGSLCRVALEYGMRPTGIEPDPVAREHARRTGPFSVYENLGALREAETTVQFDMAFLWEAIEHLRKPWHDLESLRPILKPDGWVVVSTPNASGWKARLLGPRWDNYVNRTHFYYFSPVPLRRLLEQAGFGAVRRRDFLMVYPHHGPIRRAVHRLLVASGTDGELLFTAKLPSSSSAKSG
jgi:2-polyprenyl-3-methyl-5-hydroxy-6-metoxy-1,4-benzoquinol methylase